MKYSTKCFWHGTEKEFEVKEGCLYGKVEGRNENLGKFLGSLGSRLVIQRLVYRSDAEFLRDGEWIVDAEKIPADNKFNLRELTNPPKSHECLIAYNDVRKEYLITPRVMPDTERRRC